MSVMIWSKTFFYFSLAHACSNGYQSLVQPVGLLLNPPGLCRSVCLTQLCSFSSSSHVVFGICMRRRGAHRNFVPFYWSKVFMLCCCAHGQWTEGAEEQSGASSSATGGRCLFISPVSEPSISSLTKAIFSMKKAIICGAAYRNSD